MSLEYGTYGRLYANHYENRYTKSEVCATGFNRNGAESLCQSQGYALDTYTTYANYNHNDVVCFQSNFIMKKRTVFYFYFSLKFSVSPRNSYNTVSAFCMSAYQNCHIHRLAFCPQVVYLRCFNGKLLQISLKIQTLLGY